MLANKSEQIREKKVQEPSLKQHGRTNSTAQHSTAQHSTAQHSTAQQHRSAILKQQPACVVPRTNQPMQGGDDSPCKKMNTTEMLGQNHNDAGWTSKPEQASCVLCDLHKLFGLLS